MSTFDEILRVFSYTEEEQRTFVYIRKYMTAVSIRMPEILNSDERRRRFMLAGLFLTYRACNHQGQSFSTVPGAVNLPEVDLLRLRKFREFTGSDICSTREYLDMIGANWLKFLTRDPGSILKGLVLK